MPERLVAAPGTVLYRTTHVYGTVWYQCNRFVRMTGKKTVTAPPRPRARGSDGSTRERALTAAFAVFRKRGFSGASTLEIATRAQVSKRDLYALFGSKHAMLAACITGAGESDAPTPGVGSANPKRKRSRGGHAR